MQTRDQRFASAIYKHVMKVKDESFATSYGSMAHKLPVLIHTSGLAQALAFVDSRRDEQGPACLLEDLAQAVIGKPAKDFLEQAREGDLRKYMYLTEQTLAALLWYKRYAQSLLDVEADQDDTQSKQGGRNGGE
jgi:CRISPR-associated protein Cmr5